ncbi:hypothetical protein STSP_01560 [Streptomyces jeddahensis]|uniref:Uncharacterized protein n=1 Tax=Streptomyces jeddahensis TaxID=1716141 RepID=A0A177I082_9ACTN|nr:hypothetical protein STSP_01560 [Streptomyces jeddahensis]
MRPVDDHFVRLGETRLGREYRSGIADGYVVAEEFAEPYQSCREVDRSEDDQAGGRDTGFDQQCQRATAVGPLLADHDCPGAPQFQHRPSLGRCSATQLRLDTQRSLIRPVGVDCQRATEPFGRPVDNTSQRNRLL